MYITYVWSKDPTPEAIASCACDRQKTQTRIRTCNMENRSGNGMTQAWNLYSHQSKSPPPVPNGTVCATRICTTSSN